jgi:predicted dienelactone hydrolase
MRTSGATRSPQRFFFASVTLLFVACATEPLASPELSPGRTVLTAPELKGAYNVGITVFSATLTAGRSARVQVYYPTLAPPDCGTRFTISTAAGTYQLSSPTCAVEDAAAAPQAFPLIVYDHGGTPAGADGQRIAQLPLHEALASHGFIVVVALHSAVVVDRIRDLSRVTDLMLTRNSTPGDAFFEHIDPNRIGTAGLSAGGSAVFHFVAGSAANGIAPDARVKAMVLYEPGRAAISLNDASMITVPYLIMGGTQFSGGITVPEIFAATTAAEPRVYVQVPNAVHMGFQTGMCHQIQETREAALVADPGLAEPLTTLSQGNAAAATAFAQWNMGQTQFPTSGYGFGGGRNFCNRVGVTSVRSLDVDGDGFTDSPPLLPTDAFTLAPAVRGETMVAIVKLYTIAYFKVFLEGDQRYMRFLATGYAVANGLPTIVSIAP